MAAAPLAVGAGPAPLGPAVADHGEVSTRTAAGVAKRPLALGYVFTVWSIARLRTYLHQRTGITLSINRLRN